MTDPAGADEVAELLAERFDEAGIPYAFGGALALAAWGVPRATVDVDVSAFVAPSEAQRVFDALERAGAVFERDGAARDVDAFGMFIARVRGVRIDVFLAHHPMHESMSKRRVPIAAFSATERFFLSAEDVVLTKLIYHRPKDVLDLERLFAVQAGALDLDYVRHWLGLVAGPDDDRHTTLADLADRFGSAAD